MSTTLSGSFIWPDPHEAPAKKKPQTYELKCRGGGNNQLSVRAVTSEEQYAKYWFQKSKSRYNDTMKPGECGWLDRTFVGVESNLIQFDAVLGGSGAHPGSIIKGGKVSRGQPRWALRSQAGRATQHRRRSRGRRAPPPLVARREGPVVQMAPCAHSSRCGFPSSLSRLPSR